jgi:hypothetical protein
MFKCWFGFVFVGEDNSSPESVAEEQNLHTGGDSALVRSCGSE